MRAIWSGALSFGLVNIPVKLYSATESETINLDLLDREGLTPIRYVRVRRSDGKEVPYEDIVRGYEYRKGDYIVLTSEDFRKANVKKTQSIGLQGFVKEEEIDSLYFEKPYYLEPEKGAEKPYALFREALKQAGKVGVAKFVLRNRERLAVVRPVGDVLTLEQLRFKDEIRQPTELKVPSAEYAEPREVKMALALINQLSENFKPEEYHDTYREELERIIEEKAAGRIPKAKGQAPKPTEVENLMAALKESLERAEQK